MDDRNWILYSVEDVPVGIRVKAFSIAERVAWSTSADLTGRQLIFTQGKLTDSIKVNDLTM